jgi:hypothetical protein
MISDSTAMKFRGSVSSSAKLSSNVLLPGRAINAWVVGVSTDDVSTLGRVVQTMGSTANALPPGMVRTC